LVQQNQADEVEKRLSGQPQSEEGEFLIRVLAASMTHSEHSRVHHPYAGLLERSQSTARVVITRAMSRPSEVWF